MHAGSSGNTSVPVLQRPDTDSKDRCGQSAAPTLCAKQLLVVSLYDRQQSPSMCPWCRVEHPTSQPAFDYTKARAALQKLQQAPDSRVAAGGRRGLRVPSPAPVERPHLRKRTMLPVRTRPASTRPATPPGFAAPPAPKRPHLAFGSLAAPQQAAPVRGQSLTQRGVQLSLCQCCLRWPDLSVVVMRRIVDCRANQVHYSATPNGMQ